MNEAVQANTFDHLARGDFIYRSGIAIEAVRASGATIEDTKGRTWIDLEAANGSLLLGYDASLLEEILPSWSALPTIPSFVESTVRKRFAARLGAKIAVTLGSQGLLAFENTGALGIELALRIAAMNRPGRNTIAVLEGCYHGRSLFTSNLSASHRYRAAIAASGYRIVRIPVPALSLRESGSHASETLVQLAERLLSAEGFGTSSKGTGDLLALVFEPILNVAGMIDPGTDFLNRIAGEARRAGAIIIADEVFTGYHRTGPFLASSRLSEAPDIVVMSKALTNGYSPFSAVWGRGKIMSAATFPPGSYSTTFSNSPVNFLLANAVLQRVERISDSDVSRVSSMLSTICECIVARRRDEIVGTGVTGMTAYVQFRSTAAMEETRALLTGAGLLCAATGLSPDRLLLHPPITLSDSNLRLAVSVIERALAR